MHSHWLNLAAQLEQAYARYQDKAHTPHLLQAPGRTSSNGRAADAFEGFARLTLLRAFLHKAGHATDLNLLTDALNAGLGLTQNRTARHNPWPAITDNSQAIVDTAALALALRIIGPEYLDHLPTSTRDALIARLRPALTAQTPTTNWHMFKYVLAATLQQLEGETPAAQATMQQAAEIIEQWHLGRGWYSDGPGRRIDFYNSWAFHFYPELEWHLTGVSMVPDLHQRSEQFVTDLGALIASNGAPIAFGRSLIYRYAAATGFATNLLIGAGDAAQQANSAAKANSVLNFFASRNQIPGNPQTAGWTLRTSQVAQNYSGPAASLWAAKLLVRLLIPATDPTWQTAPTPAPAEQTQTQTPTPTVLPIPGLMITPGCAFNHGTSSLQPGLQLASNLYDQLTFSSQAVPLRQHRRPHHALVFTSPTFTATRTPSRVTGHGPNWIASEDAVTLGIRPAWLQRAATLLQLTTGHQIQRTHRHPTTRKPTLHSISVQLECGGVVLAHILTQGGGFTRLHYYLPRKADRALLAADRRVWHPRFRSIMKLSYRTLDSAPFDRTRASLYIRKLATDALWLVEYDRGHVPTALPAETNDHPTPTEPTLNLHCCGTETTLTLTHAGLRPA